MRQRCAIYARYSSDLQSPTSIEDQVRLCQQYAERQGWTVVGTYRDAAISGATSERPDYRRLLQAALSTPPAFDVILVEGLDRLTREPGEAPRLHQRLQLRGVDIVGVSDGTDTSRKGASTHVAVRGLVNSLCREDLSDKTHRGLAGRVARGLTAGGRTYGYRVVEGRLEPDETQAAIVRRIWREYAEGRSQKQIAHRLNAEGVPFPSQDTQRGPARKGWTGSTIRGILLNTTYLGEVIWGRAKFIRDPDTGGRRRVPRPPDEWEVKERPELHIIPPELERAVKARLAFVRQAYGPGARRGDKRWIPAGRAAAAYPKYLLSGMLRCAECDLSMVAQTVTRRKNGHTHQQVWFRCAGAKDKGPAICRHDVSYRQDLLEGALLERLHEATATPETIQQLAELVNARVEASARGRGARAEALAAEIGRLEREAANLVRFVAEGGDGLSVREELRRLDGELGRRRAELAAVEAAGRAAPTQAHPSWVRDRLARLGELLARDPARARVEVLKHLDGPLQVRPLPALAGQRAAELVGRVKPDSLLANRADRAGCLRMVAGACNHRNRSISLLRSTF